MTTNSALAILATDLGFVLAAVLIAWGAYRIRCYTVLVVVPFTLVLTVLLALLAASTGSENCTDRDSWCFTAADKHWLVFWITMLFAVPIVLVAAVVGVIEKAIGFALSRRRPPAPTGSGG